MERKATMMRLGDKEYACLRLKARWRGLRIGIGGT